MTTDQHPFAQDPTMSVRICITCGKWPLHHRHVPTSLCTCDQCDKLHQPARYPVEEGIGA